MGHFHIGPNVDFILVIMGDTGKLEITSEIYSQNIGPNYTLLSLSKVLLYKSTAELIKSMTRGHEVMDD